MKAENIEKLIELGLHYKDLKATIKDLKECIQVRIDTIMFNNSGNTIVLDDEMKNKLLKFFEFELHKTIELLNKTYE
jgi:hypothetical protein